MTMAVHSEPLYFVEAKQKGHIVVSGEFSWRLRASVSNVARAELPKFDLETYIANYKGVTSPKQRCSPQ